MIITSKIENTYPPRWVATKKQKREYYAKGRITVLEMVTMDDTFYAPRIAGMTFKPRKGKWCKTAEDAYKEGLAMRQEMRAPPVQSPKSPKLKKGKAK